jgi:hypothetical protein
MFTRREENRDRAVLVTLALIFFGGAAAMALEMTLSFPASIFWIFAPVPGLIGLANFIVVQRRRIDEQEKIANTCAKHPPAIHHHPAFEHSLAAALVLTGVFCIVIATEHTRPGFTYAGYGVYVSTLWFMLVRLNASVLSSRFLINSAVKASIAMIIGCVVSEVGDGLGFSSKTMGAKALCFLIGLFHPMAMDRLRAMAMKTFGVTAEVVTDLPLGLLDGVDDGVIDVLEESGITSIQHLAATSVHEVCSRTLYPYDRVLDWIDQAILTMHCSGRLNDLRAAGIHSARSLVLVCRILAKADDPLHKVARERWCLAARRLGFSDDQGLRILGRCVEEDSAYVMLNGVYQQMLGQLPAVTPTEPAPEQPPNVPPSATDLAPQRLHVGAAV